MKKYILFFIGLALFVSCDKIEDCEESHCIIGRWSHLVANSEEEEGIRILSFERVGILPADTFGIQFLEDGSLIKRTAIGRGFGNPIFADLPGSWRVQNENIVTDVVYSTWVERRTYKIVDVSNTSLQLKTLSWELNPCGQNVIICKTEFENAPNHPVSIIEMKIEGDCLKIKVGSSGCTGDNWIVKLIDSESVYPSDDTGIPPSPPTRILRFSLEHIGVCAAYFTNEFSFNIRDLQVPGYNKIWLNISGRENHYDGRILYEY